jgi:hypothetical protein
MEKNRIQPTDTGMVALLKVCEGNPGAITVCTHFVKLTDSLMAIQTFDSLGIYGSRIWMLYKDVCKEVYGNVSAVMMAVSDTPPWITVEQLHHAIDNYGEGIDLEAIVKRADEEALAWALQNNEV